MIEIKLTRTAPAETLRPLDEVARVLAGAEIPPRSVRRVLVHGGDETSEVAGVERAPWRGVHRILT